jgi:hypothetical protein
MRVNHKHQITNLKQSQSSKSKIQKLGWGLELGEFEFWYCLEFGILDLKFTTQGG